MNATDDTLAHPSDTPTEVPADADGAPGTGRALAVPAAPASVDPLLAAAVERARTALVEEADAGSVGDHLGVTPEPTGSGYAATHAFAARQPGYVGWHWAVTVARAEDSDHVTVDEAVLLPGDGAVVVPEWLPWSERIRPEDLHPGDLVPVDPDDQRLVPAYLDADPVPPHAPVDPQVDVVVWELGLGRERVMSREGRLDTADRWNHGPHSAGTAMAKHAPAPCGTCGFYLPLAGSLGAAFGACGNEKSPADGIVVVADYGCGAHSAAMPAPDESEVTLHPVYDTEHSDALEVERAPEGAGFVVDAAGDAAVSGVAVAADPTEPAETADPTETAESSEPVRASESTGATDAVPATDSTPEAGEPQP